MYSSIIDSISLNRVVKYTRFGTYLSCSALLMVMYVLGLYRNYWIYGDNYIRTGRIKVQNSGTDLLGMYDNSMSMEFD